MNPLFAIAGLAVAIGGAIKDTRFEGFKWYVFTRSPAITFIISLALPFSLNPLWFFAGIGVERVIVETYKLIRKKPPSKFQYGEWQKSTSKSNPYPTS